MSHTIAVKKSLLINWKRRKYEIYLLRDRLYYYYNIIHQNYLIKTKMSMQHCSICMKRIFIVINNFNTLLQL